MGYYENLPQYVLTILSDTIGQITACDSIKKIWAVSHLSTLQMFTGHYNCGETP